MFWNRLPYVLGNAILHRTTACSRRHFIFIFSIPSVDAGSRLAAFAEPPQGKNAADLSARGRLSSRQFGIAKCLLHVYREELEVRKGVLPIEFMSTEIHVEFSTRWQPDLTPAFRKRHGTIFDVLMLQPHLDFRNLIRQIGLQTRYLGRIGENPGPPAQPQIEEAAPNDHSANGITALAFFESNLPSRSPAPLPQTFAGHIEVFEVMRMKDEYKGRRT